MNYGIYKIVPATPYLKTAVVVLDDGGEYRRAEIAGIPVDEDAETWIPAHYTAQQIWDSGIALTGTPLSTYDIVNKIRSSALYDMTPAEIYTTIQNAVDGWSSLADAKASLRNWLPLLIASVIWLVNGKDGDL